MATMHVSPGHHHSDEQANLDTPQRIGLGLFAVSMVAGIAGYMVSPETMFRSYLTGFMMAGGLPVAFLAMLMLHHLVGGEWGVILRRMLEAGTRALPYMALLMLPIAFFMMRDLYEWARPEVVMHDKILSDKAPYLNLPFFYIRAAAYYLIWILFAMKLNSLTKEQEASGVAQQGESEGNLAMRRRLNNVSGIGLLITVMCVTFAAFDWSMSTDPHWFSTIFGLVTLIGWTLTTMCIAAILMCYLRKYAPLNRILKTSHFHDFGNLMFAMTALWAYMSFSQFLIMWSGNIPEELTYYSIRMDGFQKFVGLCLVVFHFLIPFPLMLNRKNKRSLRWLGGIALLILVMRIVDLYWIVMPTFYQAHQFSSDARPTLHWLDLVAPVAIGGIWVFVFIWQLRRRPLLPLHDPRLGELEAGH